MKKKSQKKGKYLFGLLVAVVALGIGYAAITNIQLFISGTATATGSASDSDFVVRFVQSTDTENANSTVATAAVNPASYTVITGEDVTASASVTDDVHATFNVDGMVANDEVRFTYYITNLSNGLNANITPVITNEYSDNFEVSVLPAANSAFSLAVGEVKTITVTVRCIAQNLQDVDGTFNITFTSVAAE